jgi:uncharacterized protein YkwD
MKRFIFVICAFAMLVAPNAALADSSASQKSTSAKKLDANSFIGMTTQALTSKYGKPARTEASEYGFTWYIYNQDYNNFFIAGVQGTKVVALYTNAKTLTYQNKFNLGSTKAAVKAKLGSPISYIRSGNTICILNNTNQKDIYSINGNYVMVIYDNIAGGKVTSILIVPQAAEDNALINHPVLSSAVVAAYQRISVEFINAIRVRNGLNKLTTDTLNGKLAVSRSTDMRDRNYFDHYTPAPKRLSPFDQAKKIGIKYTSMGENIAYGDHNAIIAHEAFMNSAGHRSNIMKAKYTKIGAGVAYGSSRYVLLTNIFTR